MFLTIKPGEPEEIRMQLQRLHSFLHTLDLDKKSIGLLMGLPLRSYFDMETQFASPYTFKDYVTAMNRPEYYGAEVMMMYPNDSIGFLLIKLLCSLKKNKGTSKFPEYAKEALAFAEKMTQRLPAEGTTESNAQNRFYTDFKGFINQEVESLKSRIQMHLDQRPRHPEPGTYPGTTILLMDELENQFALAAVKYHYQFTEDWENHSFDPAYFDRYIPEVLYPEFRAYCQNTLEPLNDYVRSRIFENSMIQFGKTKPEERRARIFAQYAKYYWEPNQPFPPGDMELGYLYQILQSYIRHFSLFKELVDDLALKFSRNNNTAQPFLTEPKLQPSKPKLVSFNYKGHNKNPEAITELFKDLRDKQLIDSKTSVYNFKRAFLNGEPEKPIKWTGSISELHFFIKCIHNQEKKVVDLKQKHWEVAQLCFVDSLGNRFERDKLKNQKDPVSADFIRKLVRNL